jgi:hypothetical protein
MPGRLSVFFDGDMLSGDRLGYRLDWKRTRQHVVSLFPDRVLTLHYHGIEHVHVDGAPSRKLHDFLETNGFRVDVVEAELAVDGSVTHARANVLVGLAVDMMRAWRAGSREIVLLSGDSALLPVVRQMIMDGAKVTVVYPQERCSGRIRRLADEFMDLGQWQADICQRATQARASA